MTKNSSQQFAVIVPRNVIRNTSSFPTDIIAELKNKFPQITFHSFVTTYPSYDDTLRPPANIDQLTTIISLTRDFGIDANIKSAIDAIDPEKFDAAIIFFTEDVTSCELAEMINLFNENFDIISGLPANSDIPQIIIINKNIIKIVKQISEPDINIRNLIDWIGFDTATTKISTGISLYEKCKYKLKTIVHTTSFLTTFPLIAAIILLTSAFIMLTLKLTSAIYVILITMASLILLAISLVASYVIRTYHQTLNRPLYIIREKRNL